MFSKMNDHEIEIATKLINHGLGQGAGSLQQMLNSPIDIDAIDFNIVNMPKEAKFSSKVGSKIHVLNTQLIGEIKGICHLVLSEDEVNKVHKACLPESIITSQSEEHITLKNELLTEIDNIVAASAITEFANYLNIKMYGGVPSLLVMDGDSVNEYMMNEADSLSSLIQFKAYIHGPELDIIPDFVWLMEESFIAEIKTFAENADDEQLDKLLNK